MILTVILHVQRLFLSHELRSMRMGRKSPKLIMVFTKICVGYDKINVKTLNDTINYLLSQMLREFWSANLPNIIF